MSHDQLGVFHNAVSVNKSYIPLRTVNLYTMWAVIFSC